MHSGTPSHHTPASYATTGSTAAQQTNLKHEPLLAGERSMPPGPPLAAVADLRRPALELLLSLGAITGAVLLVLWQYSSVLGSPVAVVQPAHPANDPARSVYLGMGCFWHTQYDTFLVEQKPPFSRVADKTITSLVGYAGGSYMSPDGSVCYQGTPSTDYNLLGHAEVVSVELDPLTGNTSTRAAAQFESLIKHYFDEGFSRLADGKLQRLDPMDSGPEYRNAVGLPGGNGSALYPALVHAAADAGMPLRDGLGGPHHDKQDEFVVWVYDSTHFPFFKGEEYHQFHPNTVLGRWVPESCVLPQLSAGLALWTLLQKCSNELVVCIPECVLVR